MSTHPSAKMHSEQARPLSRRQPTGAFEQVKAHAKRLARNFTWSPFARATVQGVERFVPFLRAWHSFAYEQHFARITPWARTFRGAYSSFAEAEHDVPPAKQIGYDNSEAATFLPPSGALLPSDYPVLFWLERLLQENSRVFDLGGYVGISYYSYRPYLSYPGSLDWLIFDVPAVVNAGEKLARERESRGLRFTQNLCAGDGAQVYLAFGSLMFIDEGLAEILASYNELPEHLIVNKVALYDGETFVTLQDMGPAVCPYRIFNRQHFLDSVAGLGYEIVDSWSNPDLGCFVPFHAERWVPSYSGFYFRRVSRSTANETA